MRSFIAYTVIGLVNGSAFAIAASGLVLTYSTSRVFNMAHGAIGMVMAFVYWELSFNHGLPVWLGILLVVGVIAPLFGAAVQRIMMRGLADAPVSVSLVVTVGLLVFLLGGAQALWPPEQRSVKKLLDGHGVSVAGTFISANRLISFALAIAVAVLLYLFLNRSRVGVAMRAVVDNPDLVALHGAKPDLLAALSWAGGSSLAALAGIVLVGEVGLDYFALTLLVISAYAAAMLGKLQSLPLTFIGAMALGLATSYTVGYMEEYLTGWLQGVGPSMPVIFLFAVLLFLPHAPLRVGQVKGIRAVPVPSARKTLGSAAGLVLVVVVLANILSDGNANKLTLGLIYAVLMLSLVLLTGYGGYVSLAQFTFAGIGALTAARLGSGSVLAVLAAGGVAAVVGGLIALPLLRLRGLYLALGTMAFAQLMDKLLFQAPFAFQYNGIRDVERLSLPGLRLDGFGSYLVAVSVILAITSVGVLHLRRGGFGRLLIAMRDSPAACGTLGLNLTWTRVQVFALSAFIAGIAGALLGGRAGSAGATEFELLQSLPLLLLVVVCGVTSVSGAVAAGIILMLLPEAQSAIPELKGLVFLVIGGGAIALGRQPNGLAAYVFAVGRKMMGMRPPPPSAVVDDTIVLPQEALSGAS